MLDTKGQLDRYASGSIESMAIDFYTGIIKGVAFRKVFGTRLVITSSFYGESLCRSGYVILFVYFEIDLKITNVIDCSLYSFLYKYKKFYLFFLYVRVMINLE